jgi:hypothetical protein
MVFCHFSFVGSARHRSIRDQRAHTDDEAAVLRIARSRPPGFHIGLPSGETWRVFFRQESDLDLGDGALMQSLLEADPFRENDSHKE